MVIGRASLMQDSVETQLQYFSEVAFSLRGLIGLLALAALAVLLVRFPAWKWVVLTVLLYAATLGVASDQVLQKRGNDLAPPLQQIRLYSRPIAAMMLALLLIPAGLSFRGWRTRLVLGATVAYFAFETVISLRIGYAGFVSRALFGLILFGLMFLTLGLGLPRWLQDWSNVYTALRCVAFAGILVLAGTAYQLAINPSTIIHQSRLFGTTNNPNTIGYITSIALPAICVLLARREEPKVMRVVMGGAAGLFVVFLVWAGSRGGMLITLISVGLLFRRRLGTFALVALVCSVFALIGFQVFSDSTAGAGRLFTMEDTRSLTWQSQWQAFLSNPWIGYRSRGAFEGFGQYQENFYLGVAASNGLLGLIPLAVLMAMLFALAVRLTRARKWLGEHGILCDLFVGLFASLAIGAVFEAHLAANLAFSVLGAYIMLAIAGFLLDAAAYNAALAGSLPAPAAANGSDAAEAYGPYAPAYTHSDAGAYGY